MIFYEKSPRNISIENAEKLQIIAENLNIDGVGVFVNKNITISNLLGYFYNYDPNYINISNLLKSYQTAPQKNINITELLNRKIDSIEVCN